jgi:mycothiol synthase
MPGKRQPAWTRRASVSSVPDVSTAVPDETTRVAIIALAGRIAGEDGAPPLSDDALTHLSSSEVQHAVARQGGRVVGYGQRRDGSAEVAAEPDAAHVLIDAIAAPGLLIWTHGRGSRLTPALRERGFKPVRELYQLRRALDELPPDPPLPAGVTVRSFQPGRDEAAWLEVNAAAFAAHAEQGRRTLAELQALMAEPWFAPWDFLLADRNGELLGFHWTKVHSADLGEVYVLGISPEAQGLGLGNALLVRGLRHLAERGCAEVLLYVDGDNTAARRLYERAGFGEYDLDVQWQAADK